MKTYAIPVQISTVEGVGYWAECQGLQGCFVDGETLEEVISDFQDAAALYIASCTDLGLPLPGSLELRGPLRGGPCSSRRYPYDG